MPYSYPLSFPQWKIGIEFIDLPNSLPYTNEKDEKRRQASLATCALPRAAELAEYLRELRLDGSTHPSETEEAIDFWIRQIKVYQPEKTTNATGRVIKWIVPLNWQQMIVELKIGS